MVRLVYEAFAVGYLVLFCIESERGRLVSSTLVTIRTYSTPVVSHMFCNFMDLPALFSCRTVVIHVFDAPLQFRTLGTVMVTILHHSYVTLGHSTKRKTINIYEECLQINADFNCEIRHSNSNSLAISLQEKQLVGTVALDLDVEKIEEADSPVRVVSPSSEDPQSDSPDTSDDQQLQDSTDNIPIEHETKNLEGSLQVPIKLSTHGIQSIDSNNNLASGLTGLTSYEDFVDHNH
ncbi:hypothetical protein CTI12_AA255600 [Artemisia annua]|uniref:Uncharacterized protein n=1 Tax=Artemisia annua TaxID=35608 RepID=A0A2U1NKF5_ARTAN|nr:hypothetical protein CTI12_AA255600 [Artemisia annua]